LQRLSSTLLTPSLTDTLIREGAAMTLRLALNPTAAPIREGHRLRIGAAKA
jgi:hypothetical protein